MSIVKKLQGINEIADKEVYPIVVKNGGKEFLTLYYYTDLSDSILHTSQELVYFENFDELKWFCQHNSLSIQQDLYTFNFDVSLINPTDYKVVLENWNLLNTVADIFNIDFDGNSEKYNDLYELLFNYCTSETELPQSVVLDEKSNQALLRVFEKKNSLLDRFVSINNI